MKSILLFILLVVTVAGFRGINDRLDHIETRLATSVEVLR